MEQRIGNVGVVSALKEAIKTAANQRIPFQTYMEICLYQETYGYYRNDQIKIGKQGDFYTSSSIGTVMGEMVASYISKDLQQSIRMPASIQLVEWGGGNGRMALQILDELKSSFPNVYARTSYAIIESSPYHRQLQRDRLVEHAALTRFVDETEWLKEMPEEHVYVIANELLDAFPVQRVRYLDDHYQESYVTWQDQLPHFIEVWFPVESQRTLDYLSSIEVQWREGQIGEVNLGAWDWYARLSGRMRSGAVIAIDYGDIESELFAPHRHQGTLMCYRKHEAHDNPFLFPGEQDITAHVNFSYCQRAAMASGFDVCPLVTQRQFLVDQGILEKLQNHADPNPFSEVSKRNRSIRQLLLSDGMSELFKVCITTKKGELA
ncbi:hypothetical protein A8709_24345 [Paenibacillus pectinilyticus]|uniref:SAM-dependent methyltransferase n=1 Tax=Paenibacillus pectinilyticus TaxID=512399 RepID=A0A1C1A926_9BACL|nr:SAM-dependent methyltransferase [Paenibacillus pectinilyticus]OCT17118.1 hypothetical protein A8709_24345 [Paenibacillus pectinilyticus]